MKAIKLVFYLKLLIISYFIQEIQSQVCGDQDAVYITQNSNLFAEIHDDGQVGFQSAGILVGGSLQQLSPTDTLVVMQNLRQTFQNDTHARPECTVETRGMIWNAQICFGSTSVAYWMWLPWAFSVQGYPVRDNWGLVWDGLDRNAATWATALATCTSVGARLPSVSELNRNIVDSIGGAVNIAEYPIAVSSPLWTQVAVSPGAYYTLILKGGAPALGTAGAGGSLGFRCVLNAGAPLFPTNCNLGSCNYGYTWYVIDSSPRPSLSFLGAYSECGLYSASVPTLQLAQLLGLTISGNSYWVSTLFSNSNTSVTLGAVTGSLPNPNYGAIVAGAYPFYCVGLNPNLTPEPITPACNGQCITVKNVMNQFIVDSQDRTNTTFEQALTACLNVNGNLPEYADMLAIYTNQVPRQGMLWSLDNFAPPPTYAITYAIYDNNTNLSFQSQGSSNFYRCIWKQSLPFPQNCNGQQMSLGWDSASGSVVCVTNTLSTPVTGGTIQQDAWGYAWDGADRSAANYSVAVSTCSSYGGRLPYPTELYRARSDPSNVVTSSITTSPSFLLSNNPSISVNFSSGAIFGIPPYTSVLPFRCVWPPLNEGTFFGGSKCYGPPSSPCFQFLGNYLIDQVPRVSMTYPQAVTECQSLGGTLPSYSQYLAAVYLGLPNPSGNWIASEVFQTTLMYPVSRTFVSGGFASPSNTWGPYSSAPTLLSQFRCLFTSTF
jgi:hypothetical protein